MRVYFSVQETGDKKGQNTPGGDELMKKLGATSAGLPYFAFLDAKGEMLANSMAPGKNGKLANIGHPYQPEEVDWFMSMLQKAAPSMTPEERTTLEKYLRAQKK